MKKYFSTMKIKEMLKVADGKTVAEFLDKPDDFDLSEIDGISPELSLFEQVKLLLEMPITVLDKEYEDIYYPSTENLSFDFATDNKNLLAFRSLNDEDLAKTLSSCRCDHCNAGDKCEDAICLNSISEFYGCKLDDTWAV